MPTPTVGAPLAGYYYDAATNQLRPLVQGGPPGPVGPVGPTGPAGPPGGAAGQADNVSLTGANVTIPAVGWQKVPLNSQNVGFNWDNTNKRWVCPTTGAYNISGVCSFTMTSAQNSRIIVSIWVNGVERTRGTDYTAGTTTSTGAGGTAYCDTYLFAGDYVELYSYSNPVKALEWVGGSTNSNMLTVRLLTGTGPTGPQGPQGIQGVPGDLTQAVADGLYVNVTGDTMTGDLQVNKLKTASGNLVVAANLGVLDVQSQAKVLIGPAGVLNDGQDPNVVVPKSYLETTTIYRGVANTAQRDAWTNAPNGALCVVSADYSTYIRKGTSWYYWASPWRAFTPTLICPGGTNPTLGTGSTQMGRYRFVEGNTIQFSLNIAFGTGGGFAPGNGQYVVAGFPIPMSVNFGNYLPAGSGHVTLTAGNAQRYNPQALRSPSANGFEIYLPAPWYSNSPAAPVAGNAIQLWGQYECDNYLA
jgi:hypothetical protein